jgi:ribosomal protein S18 acetylase RimI-like enzyme
MIDALNAGERPSDRILVGYVKFGNRGGSPQLRLSGLQPVQRTAHKDNAAAKMDGVRPEHQGKGWGSAAILQGLTRARSERLPVYLETAKGSNVALYRKLGFKLIGEWDVPKGGPHFWSMLCEKWA